MILMEGVRIDLISEDRMDDLTTMEKINLILNMVKDGSIVVLERGLAPEEEAKLIEVTMTSIHDDFTGIEIESYPAKSNPSLISKLLGRPSTLTRLTVIGPANQLKTIKKDQDLISALVSSK